MSPWPAGRCRTGGAFTVGKAPGASGRLVPPSAPGDVGLPQDREPLPAQAPRVRRARLHGAFRIGLIPEGNNWHPRPPARVSKRVSLSAAAPARRTGGGQPHHDAGAPVRLDGEGTAPVRRRMGRRGDGTVTQEGELQDCSRFVQLCWGRWREADPGGRDGLRGAVRSGSPYYVTRVQMAGA